MSSTPTLADLLAAAGKHATAVMHVCMPAKVVSFDLATQTIIAQPTVKDARRTAAGDVVQEDFPPIPDIPVAYPSAAGFSMVYPLSVGDPVTLVFAERSLSEWKSTGNSSNTPQSLDRFQLTDAIAIPGGTSPAVPIPAAGVDATALVIQGTLIKLGSSAASDFVGLSTPTNLELAKLLTLLQTWIPVPGDGGLALKTAALLLSQASVAATKVQAE